MLELQSQRLVLCQVDVISREDARGEDIAASGHSSPGHGQVLRMRMSPHNVAEVSRVEMLADCPIDHPFFVKDKGKMRVTCHVTCDTVWCDVGGKNVTRCPPVSQCNAKTRTTAASEARVVLNLES